MRRGEKQGPLIRSQRASLPGFHAQFRGQLQTQLSQVHPSLDGETSFADQGIVSQKLIPLAQELAKYFPNVAAHDLYRFNSLEKLIKTWDGENQENSWSGRGAHADDHALDILACGVRLPAGVESPGRNFFTFHFHSIEP